MRPSRSVLMCQFEGTLLRRAGCGNVVSIGAVDNLKNAKGYKRPALEDALSVEDSAA
ncbi:hypothetical protein ACFTZK_00350 [Streptomyces decoyicus]|uniref:hypothetical protein n=1 Tax=Streptomyces decoyicus TaxID=249567 RepID=UPI00363AD04E